MRIPVRKKRHGSIINNPFILKGLAVLFLLCILIKAAASAGGQALTDGFMSRLMQDEGIAGGILSIEMGSLDAGFPPFFKTLFFDTPGAADSAAGGIESKEIYEEEIEESAKPVRKDTEKAQGGLFYGGQPPAPVKPAEESSAENNTGVVISKNADGILLDNTTSQKVDIQALLSEPLDIKLKSGEPAVLIIHTHTSEAYTQSGNDTYTASDPYRTEDKSKNITRVGDELAAELEARGIVVVHDRRSYDYPSYTGSYNRTYSSVQAYLKQYPSIKLVIDMHRDSITAADGSQYKTIAQIGDVTCSQVMFVVGSDDAGLEHPAWRENLKLALHLQSEMNERTPTLARPVRISQYRYNQQIAPGSLILEVGCAGNTLEESLTAIRFFAESAANVFNSFYE